MSLVLSSCTSSKSKTEDLRSPEAEECLAEDLANGMVLQCRSDLDELGQKNVRLDGQNEALRSENAQLRADQAALGELRAENERLSTAHHALETEGRALRTRIDACVEELGQALHPDDIRDRLALIEGFGVQEMKTQIPGARVFAIRVEQALDHANPGRGRFSQRFVLLHRSDSLPMTLMTTGYGLFGGPDLWVNHEDELTVLTGSNQIILEHRYFEGSMPVHADPADIDWTYLTIEQSAADSHAIVEKLKPIYPGPWIATGRSKGGMTAIFHQRFYPNDLAGIVPFVAPISHGIDDTRYDRWMTEIGPSDGRCRSQIEALSVELVRRRADLASLIRQRSPHFNVFRADAVEAGIAMSANIAWALWQYWGSRELCESVPRPGADTAALAQWVFASPSQILQDSGEPNYDQYVYQWMRELGGPSQSAPYWEAAVVNVDFSMLPGGSPPVWESQRPMFDPTAMESVVSFLANEATRVVAVYGAWDPWSAGRIQVNESRESRVFVAPAVGHRADLASLSTGDRTRALALLHAMYGAFGFTSERGLSGLEPSPDRWRRMQESRRWLDERIQKQQMGDFRRAFLSSLAP